MTQINILCSKYKSCSLGSGLCSAFGLMQSQWTSISSGRHRQSQLIAMPAHIS